MGRERGDEKVREMNELLQYDTPSVVNHAYDIHETDGNNGPDRASHPRFSVRCRTSYSQTVSG